MKTNEKLCLAGGVFLLAAAAALQLAARRTAGFASWYARNIYRMIVGIIGRIYGLFSFSVVEVLLYLLIFCIFLCVWWERRHPLKILSRFVFLLGLLAFLYTANCGINYYAAPFSAYADLSAGKYSAEELKELCEWLTEQVNQAAEVQADETYSGREAVSAMQKLGDTYPVLSGFYPRPKRLAISRILSVQQLSGVYSPFTVEANYNGEMTAWNIPHTMCHELSHLKGFMREDEANFIGWLACIGSDSADFRYSGWLTGWVYAGNALAKADAEAYAELRSDLCARADADLRENNAFWARYEGKAAEVSTKVNDAYLKVNGRTDGVQSYGRAVDLMLAYFYSIGKE